MKKKFLNSRLNYLLEIQSLFIYIQQSRPLDAGHGIFIKIKHVVPVGKGSS